MQKETGEWRMNDELDDFQSRKPIDVISSNRPILILDEPQKMEGKKTLDLEKDTFSKPPVAASGDPFPGRAGILPAPAEPLGAAPILCLMATARIRRIRKKVPLAPEQSRRAAIRFRTSIEKARGDR